MSFKEITPYEIDGNIFDLIKNKWFLVTAGNPTAFNCMTASWGMAGFIWNKPTFTTVIRPQRYTKLFVDANGTASFSFLPEEYRDTLKYLGRVSGREENKTAKSGLTPIFDNGTVYFDEAELVIIGKKLYSQTVSENCFENPEIAQNNYPSKDFHTAYTYEILRVLIKEK